MANSKFNQYFVAGNKKNRSVHFITQESPQKNHGGGVNFMSSSSHGNTASDWASSPQSPPQDQDASGHWRCTT